MAFIDATRKTYNTASGGQSVQLTEKQQQQVAGTAIGSSLGVQAPAGSNPFTLEELSRGINDGSITTQAQVDAQIASRGYSGNTTQNRVSGAPSTPLGSSGGSSNPGNPPLGGGSDGSQFGSAGAGYNPGGTTYSYDSAGNRILGKLGGKNVITGGGVDRSAGVNQDPMNAWSQFTDPNYFINRSEDIRKEVERKMQGSIDAINQRYEGQVRREEEAGAQDLARQRSMNLRAGLGGSDFGAANKAEVRTRTSNNIKDIQANQDIAVGNAITQIETIAQNRITMEQTAMQNAFSNSLAVKQMQNQEEEQARTLIKELGASGLDIATIKEKDPALYASVLQASGLGEVAAEAMMNSAKAKAEQVEYQYKYSGGKLVAFGINPLTGEMKVVEQEIDLPENYEIVTMDNGMVFGKPENWDGNLATLKPVGNYAKPEMPVDDGLWTTEGQDPLSGSILAQTGLSLAAFYVLTGQASKLPRDAKTRTAAFAEATAFANAKGVDVSTLGSQYEALNNTLKFNTTRQTMAVVAENEIVGTIQNMQGITGDFSKLNFANVAKVWAGQEVNDTIAQQYAFHLGQLRNEIVAYNMIAQGQFNSDGSLKSATDADLREAENIIKSGISAGSLQGLNTAVENSTSKMKPILQTSIDAANKAVWGLFGVGGNYQSANGTTLMLSPDGKQYNVPNAQVQAWLAAGGAYASSTKPTSSW